MPKDDKSLEESRKIREYLRQKYGFIPRSILSSKWDMPVQDSFKAGYTQHMQKEGQIGTPWKLSGIGSRHGDHSRFPQNIGMFLTKFFTPEKLTDGSKGYFNNSLPTILDPFAGHVSRLQVVYNCGRNYVGWDLSQTFMVGNRTVAEELQRPSLFPSEVKIELVEGDSRTIKYDSQFDFCLSSPPFWCIEDYGNETGQLGKLGGYNDFLDGLQVVINNCYKALKQDTFIAWEVNDFRWDREYYTFHNDTIACFKKAGFAIHDIMIVDYISGFLFKFASQMEEQKIVAKTHSYIIVGRKGGIKRYTNRNTLLEEANKDGR